MFFMEVHNLASDAIPGVRTKFVSLAHPVPIGSLLDGWRVTWCQPDRYRVAWHVMLVRCHLRFRGCCEDSHSSSH